MPDQNTIKAQIQQEFEESIAAKQRAIDECLSILVQIAEALSEALHQGNKLLLCGNGGSAADAQHIAAELVSRYKRNRRALAAIALTTDTSILTSAGNDFGYEYTFSRQVEALGIKGDVLIAISTSGQSANVLRAVQAGKDAGLVTIGFTGKAGGELAQAVDLCFCVPSSDTPRIQEVHITAAHALCDILEQELGEEHG